jgi:hypothetical protein
LFLLRLVWVCSKEFVIRCSNNKYSKKINLYI